MVGTGSLSMPNGFGDAGYLLGVIVILIVCALSFVTVTFITESLAIANAAVSMKVHGTTNPRSTDDKLLIYQDPGSEPEFGSSHNNMSDRGDVTPLLDSRSHSQDSETNARSNPLVSLDDVASQSAFEYESAFEMRQKFEVGELCTLFIENQLWSVLFYFCISVYLFGDLAIYAAAVPKSVRDVICSNLSDYQNQTDDDPCWTGHEITRMNVYRCMLTAFFCTFGIFTFFDVAKTVPLQIGTGLIRWTSFVMMVVLAIKQIAKGKGASPKAVDFGGFFNLFGVLIYSFMCHHSVPTLIMPLKNKKYAKEMVLLDYTAALTFYLLNSIVAVFAFRDLEDLYTENFISADIKNGCKYFIGLFPAMVLCTSFPIVAVVLRNNLKALFRQLLGRSGFPFVIDRIGFPLVCLVFPLIVAMITDDVSSLMTVTGGLSGAFIEFFFPALVVYYSRKKMHILAAQYPEFRVPTHYRSYFQSVWIVYAMFVWTAVCLVMTVISFFV